MQEPRAAIALNDQMLAFSLNVGGEVNTPVVCREPEGDIAFLHTGINDVSPNRIFVVEFVRIRTPDDEHIVLSRTFRHLLTQNQST